MSPVTSFCSVSSWYLSGWRPGSGSIVRCFYRGANDGFATAVKIIPYLIAILVAIGVFQELPGAMEVVMSAYPGIEGLGF